MSILKHILSNNSHWQVNKEFARAYGLEAAVLMTDLIDKWIFFGGVEWFYNTSESIQENTTLTYHKQKKCLELLMKNGFIETSLRGTPAKLYFRIVENNVLNFFNSSFQKIQKLDFEKFETNKNIINNNKDEYISAPQINQKKSFRDKNYPQWTQSDFLESIKDAAQKRKEEAGKPNFSSDMLNAFFNYWIAPTPKGAMLFTKQKSWQTMLRLITWQNNDLNKRNG